MGGITRQSKPAEFTVMQSIRTIRSTTNPYVTSLLEGVGRQVPVQLFSWKRALFGDYDVLHIHWPELLFTRKSKARTLAHSMLTVLLLARLRFNSVAVVSTMHNIAPHDTQSRLTHAILRAVDRRTTLWIALNSETSAPQPGPVVVIPIAHYRDWYSSAVREARQPGRMGFFGQVRDYKNVSALLQSFRAFSPADARLDVWGSANDPKLAGSLRRLAEGDPRIDLRLEHVPDDELAAMITRSSLIVLPYREMNNSAALFLALSLDRPVLVPANPVTDLLAEEVGTSWIQRYCGDLTADDLRAALESAPIAGSPDLGARDWGVIVDAHVAAYRTAIRVTRD